MISLDTLMAAKKYTQTYVAQHGGEVHDGSLIWPGSVTLDENWSGDHSPYTHAVSVNGYTVTPHTKIDLYPDAQLLEQMLSDRTDQIYIINDNGVLTAVALGMKPTHSMTVQATFTEVN